MALNKNNSFQKYNYVTKSLAKFGRQQFIFSWTQFGNIFHSSHTSNYIWTILIWYIYLTNQ